jgi:hypothetical protein
VAVPARPVAGAVVESGWGQVAHDTAVAMDIQAGTLSMSLSALPELSATVVFPRPFNAVPVVVLGTPEIGGTANRAIVAKHNGLSATQFGLVIQNVNGTVTTQGPFVVHWLAYGPRK